MSALPLLTLAALGGALLVALRLGLQRRGRAPVPARSRATDEEDARLLNPFRAVGCLPATEERTPRAGGAPRSAASAAVGPGPAPLRLRALLGDRYRLEASVPLGRLVRFDDRRFGSPAEHRRLRSRTVPWVVAEGRSGRVRLVVAPPAGLRGLVAAALEAEAVTVWGFERWRRELGGGDALDLRNALVRAGLRLDPPDPAA